MRKGTERTPDPETSMAPAVRAEGIYKLFKTDLGDPPYNAALNDVSLTVNKGSLTIIAGANGSGKSVLMQIIAGLMEPTEGKVFTSGKVGLVFQEAGAQILGDTPLEDVCVGLENMGLRGKDAVSRAEAALGSTGLLEKKNYPAEFLSGGEKRRLAVAAILAMERDIIIFDEPYANLDFSSVREVSAQIEELHGGGKTVILLTHELEKCMHMADNFVVLHKGRKVYDGSPSDALGLSLEDWGIHNPLKPWV